MILRADPELAANCREASKINLENLERILRDNRDTEFGKKYRFSEITGADGYRSRLPLADYGDFREAVLSMYTEGASGKLTAYPVATFCCSSGTGGEVKRIPLTFEALARYSDIIERRQNALLGGQAGGRRMFTGTFRTDLSGGYEKNMLCSEAHYRYLYEHGLLNAQECVGGEQLLFCREAGDLLYAKAWLGLLSEDIVMLESIFLYEILHYFDYLEKNWQELLASIQNRQIPEGIRLPLKIRELLLACPCPPGRLRLLERELAKGFDGIAQRLWPRLQLLSGISSRSFFAENQALDRYAGGIPKYFLGYCASECYMGKPVADDDFRYVLLPESGFYEFLPYPSGRETEKTLLPEELEPGNYYEIVVTNFSGLYRYRMGDILYVTGFEGESPVFEFWSRENRMLNIAGEKVCEGQLEAAIRGLGGAGIRAREFCVWASIEKIPGNYFALLVLEDPSPGETAREIGDRLDAALAAQNVDYADLRRLGQLERPEVILYGAGEYREFIRKNTAERRHGKPVHILPGIRKKGEVIL